MKNHLLGSWSVPRSRGSALCKPGDIMIQKHPSFNSYYVPGAHRVPAKRILSRKAMDLKGG
jgi:hypothetical protein